MRKIIINPIFLYFLCKNHPREAANKLSTLPIIQKFFRQSYIELTLLEIIHHLRCTRFNSPRPSWCARMSFIFITKSSHSLRFDSIRIMYGSSYSWSRSFWSIQQSAPRFQTSRQSLIQRAIFAGDKLSFYKLQCREKATDDSSFMMIRSFLQYSQTSPHKILNILIIRFIISTWRWKCL